MKTINYKDINEKLYFEELENGLKIYFLPKAGFNKTYVTISTPLGSNVTKYVVDGKVKKIPLGVAHFLEHKLFDKDGKDVSEEFALNDAQVNAYTMNNRTTYLFSSSDNVNTNIKTLLDLVFKPIFTEEGIKKEIGVISQEIKMYEDDPNTVIYMGALRNMYKNHPVRNDILGSIESINTITKELLDDVHNTFYSPSNMIMFITGNINIEDVLSVIKDNVPNTEKTIIINNIKKEDSKVVESHNEKTHDILIPNSLLAIKTLSTNFTKENIIKKELTYSILFDILIGKSSKNFLSLLESELVNDTFGLDITFEETYGYIMMGGSTNYPDEFFKRMKEILKDSINHKVDIDHFNRTKKQIVGGFITALNSLEYIANQFTKFHYQEASLFDILHEAKSITIEDIEEAKQILLDDESYTTFAVYPEIKR